PLGGSRAGRAAWARNILLTFVLSGLWHGASWNYVLWGTYHGLLLILTRARGMLSPARPAASRALPAFAVPVLTILQIAGMFVLTLIGWLLFRETELSAIGRDLRLSPFAATALDRQAGLYLFALALVYSMPLWIHSIWAEFVGPDTEGARSWPRLALQGIACGLAFAAILVFRSRTSLDFIYFQF
ncbi:MAG: MBOAT family O-acyltransferase, partial [Acidobacteriota bacterium]